MGLRLSKRKPIVVETRVRSVEAVVRNDDRTHKFITTRRHPIYYMPITKCGSTFLKNLFYVLDHDQPHENPKYIHEYNQDFLRADKTDPDLLVRSPYAFTVLRRPSSRFMSLYFDKIYGDGPQNFPDIRLEIAKDCGLDLTPGLDVLGHRANCSKLIGWLARNIAGDTDIEINPHWRPQMARVATVGHLKIGFLTLDGLDWQLPQLLGRVVPDLKAKMVMASSRNVTKYPFAASQILTPALEREINEVYADDLVQYQHISRYWAANRLPEEVLVEPETGLSVLTTRTQNLNMVVMQKAGCTFVRNLTYRLDHGRVHPRPEQIDTDGCLAYRAKSAKELDGGVNVIVLRNPYARFFSLYFDKVWGDGQQAFPWIARQLEKNRRFRKERTLSVAEHHDNCCRLLGFLQVRFEEREAAELNPHWRPQIVKVERARPYGFKPVLLEDFDAQMRVVAEGRVRHLDAALDERLFVNATKKPISPDELISPWIKERLQALYGEDIALYERIKAGWADTGMPPEL